MFSKIPLHTSTRAGTFHFTLWLWIGSILLCCSCWFRLPLPLAGSKPAVTLTLVLQICSVQQNCSLCLFYACVLTYYPTLDTLYTFVFNTYNNTYHPIPGNFFYLYLMYLGGEPKVWHSCKHPPIFISYTAWSNVGATTSMWDKSGGYRPKLSVKWVAWCVPSP